MPEGNYKAIAKCDLKLPDSPAYWKEGEDYECLAYEDGSVCIAPQQGGNIYFGSHVVADLCEVFEFMRV